MDRRSFLTVLGSGLVGATLCDVPWIPKLPSSKYVAAAVGDGGPIVGMSKVAAEMIRLMRRQWPELRGEFVPGDYRLGTNGMTDQYSVAMLMSDMARRDGLDTARYLAPAAHQLVLQLRDKGAVRFGALPIPFTGVEDGAVATDHITGLTVRALLIGAGPCYAEPEVRIDAIFGRRA